MDTTKEQLDNLRLNLERLLRGYQAILRENEMLKQQIDAQRRGLADKNKKIGELEQQFDLVKTAQTIAGIGSTEELPEDKIEVRKRINELIKEVDNCIALLND